MVKTSGKNPTNLGDISNGLQDKPSLRSRRLEVVGTRKNARERRRHACLPRACPFSLFTHYFQACYAAKTNPPRITLAPLTCFSFSLMMCKRVVHGFSAMSPMRILAALLARTAACNRTYFHSGVPIQARNKRTWRRPDIQFLLF